MSSSAKRVVVVGAGIVGLSCALHAQQRGHRVTVVDPRGFAGGASAGNAGILAVSDCVPIATPELLRRVPRMLFDRDSPLTMRWSYAPRIAPWLYRFLRSGTARRIGPAMESLARLLSQAKSAHRELAAMAGAQHFIKPTGWIKAFERDETYDAAQVDVERMRKHGVECQYLDHAALQERQPNLSDIFRHAIFHPACDQVIDPAAYVQAYGQEFLRRGGSYIRAEILALERKGGVATAVRSQTDKYDGDCFVIAAGAWSKKLCADAGAAVPLDTERGYHIVLGGQEDELPSAPVYWGERSIVMSPQGGSLRVTSSVELAGLHRPADFSKLRKLIPEIRRAHRRPPGRVLAEWLGFRPSMPDSLPVIGRAPAADNTFLAFGHGHLGLTLGPISGALVAQLIDGEAPDLDLSPFSAGRFHAAGRGA